ncbi:MAG: helix-turn-helix transcriptional regulator [Pseudomonadaceae bacterium]|nr:helix-turn-helix transcriptional regulator [Pseudomonadaceae bacterium]
MPPAKSDYSKDLVAASATPLILSVLRNADSYGYDIIARVALLSGGKLQWAEGMLYPLLHRLEGRELIKSYWGKSDTGRRRKYYQITPAGEQTLQSQRNQWREISDFLSRAGQAS